METRPHTVTATELLEGPSLWEISRVVRVQTYITPFSFIEYTHCLLIAIYALVSLKIYFTSRQIFHCHAIETEFSFLPPACHA